MQLVQSGKVCSFEISYDANNLNVAMSVYDDSGGSPSLVQGPTAMDVVVGNMYRAKFTPDPAKTYLIFKAVYTDGTLTTLDSSYNSGSESIRSEDLASKIKKNTALSNFTFKMFDTDGNPKTGLTITATRSKDGAAFGACDNSAAEISGGWYKINLSATDLNADFVALNFTASGALPAAVSFPTEAV